MSPSSIRTKLSSVWKVVLVLLAGWILLNLLQTAHWLYEDYSPVPVMDYWRVPQYWPNYHAARWSTLWLQHNEHRIVFPEIVFALDMLLLQGRMYLPIAFSALCYLGVWVLLVWAAYAQEVVKTPVREIALLTAGLILSWKGSSSVIATPFQLQFTLSQFACAASFVLLAKLVETGRNGYLGGVIAAAVIANYSSANGMLLWFVLIALALLVAASRSQTLALITAALLSISSYFIHYHFFPSSIYSNLHYPLRALQFFCIYMSMPFGSFFGSSFGVFVGFLNALLTLTCFFLMWRRGMMKSHLGILLCGMYSFTALSAILTTLGRMEPQDVWFTNAKAWRYLTFPMLSWALLSIALVWLAGEAKSRQYSLPVALLLCSFFGYGFVKARDWLERTRQEFREAQVTAIMLQNDIVYPGQIRTVFPDAELVRLILMNLKKSNKMMFAQTNDPWLGQNIARFSPSQEPCAGAVTRVYPVKGGVEFLGWADSNSLTQDHAVLFVDATQTIVGFGSQPRAGLPSTLRAWDTPTSLSFVGFAASKRPLGPLTVYVRTSHGKRVQPLSTRIEVPSFLSTGSTSDAPELPGVTWQRASNWTIRGYPVSAENGPPPPSGTVYGSWSGSDSNTGIMRSAPIATPPDYCLLLPVLHGITAYRQSVEVRDPETGRSLGKIPMLDGRSVWERWRIPIPATTHKLIIEADDEGTGPNQWLALGAPELCSNSSHP